MFLAKTVYTKVKFLKLLYNENLQFEAKNEFNFKKTVFIEIYREKGNSHKCSVKTV